MSFLDESAFQYDHFRFGESLSIHADCFEWLNRISESSIHSIVTDPPYGVKEYHLDQIEKMNIGQGGIWRLPPSFDGSNRSPLPRFTALNDAERANIHTFFCEWGKIAIHALRPGGHIFIATNAFLSQLVFSALVSSGLEFRGEIIRLVRTFRGGDRPKNAEEEFPDVCSMPRSGYEPWGIFRKPLPPKMTLRDCLRLYETGGIKRISSTQPFTDVILSERTPRRERAIANHPSLKPQSFMRQIVRASLPVGKGIIVDPFMGSGATVAAAYALGLSCIGVERYDDYFNMSKQSIPRLAALSVEMATKQLPLLDSFSD